MEPVTQQQMDIIEELGPDPVWALEILTGANRRTCERWASGAAGMNERLIGHLKICVSDITSTVGEFRKLGVPNAIVKVAASRLPSQPVV